MSEKRAVLGVKADIYYRRKGEFLANKGFFRTLRAFSCGAALLASLFASVSLFSCSNMGDDYSSAALFSQPQSGGTLVQAKIGKARVCGTIEKDSGVSASVVPTAADVISSASSYAVYAWGTKADGTEVPQTSPINGTVSSGGAGVTFSIDLDYGTWTVRADALDSSTNVVLSKTTAEPLVLDEDNPLANLSFSLSYLQDPSVPGSLSLTLNYSTTAGIASIRYSLQKKSGGSPLAGTVAAPASGTFTLDSAASSDLGTLVPGEYDLVAEFLSATGATIMRLDQTVQIYSNITTNKIDGSAPYISGGSVNVSDSVITKYQQSVVYVGGTGVNTGTAASDANNGTQFDPVETLGRAFAIADSLISVPTDGVKIYVQDNISLTQNVAIASSKKIRVIGTNQSAPWTISGAYSDAATFSITTSGDFSCSYIVFDKINGFEVAGGQTTLNNCKITNGKAPAGKEGGGGLCVDVGGAKAVLSSCVISGCASDDFGGAIYVAADSGSGNAEVELKNCVIGDEESTACASDVLYSNHARTGGGIYAATGGKASLEDCKIFYNSATVATGGGINCYGGTIEISGGQINHNYAAYGGGGIYIQAAPLGAGGAAVIDNCVIGDSSVDEAATAASCGNYSKAEGGGGIYFKSGSLTTTSGFDVKRNYCVNNSTTIKNGAGGGIYIGSALNLEGCQINYNFAETAGGGIYLAEAESATIDSCVVKGNVSKQDGGGLMLSKNSTATISGSEISYNTAEYYGFGGGANVQGKATFTNTNISYNKALCVNNDKYGGTGGAIYIDTTNSATLTDKTAEIQNCKITNNQASNNATGISGAQGGSGGGVAIISGDCSISGDDTDISANQAQYNGGGLYARENSVTFNFSGGTISANTVQKGKGGAVYNNGILAMGGSAYIPAGSDKKNDVYLTSNKTISLASSLTATPTPVATITPISYSNGRTVIDLAAGSSVTSAMMTAELAKFATKTAGWTIGKKAAADEGVLTVSEFYVRGDEGVDDESHGTDPTSPYKTLAYACSQLIAPNCTIFLISGTTETEDIIIPAVAKGLAIKSYNAAAQKTVTASGNKQLVGNGNFSATKITFDHYSVRIFAAGSDTERTELNDVEIINADQANAGGGLNVSGGSVVSATNLKITNCQAENGGGGINVSATGKFTADGITISGCKTGTATVAQGGGIRNYGSVSLRDAKILGCTAGGVGAGIYNYNSAELILDNETNIDSEIYLAGKNGPINLKTYFELAGGAGKIPVAVEMDTSATNHYVEGDVVVKGSGSGGVTEAQCQMFEMPGSKYSIEYDDAATPPCGKLVDKSIAGGVTVNLGGSILFEIGTPNASGEKARFNVIDNSSGTPTYVTPTSAQIKILQYGTPVYSADAQEVAATYLAEGEYELYCKAVVGGVTYDTTLPFGAGAKYTPLTLEAAQAGAVVTFTNKAAGDVTYRVNGGTEQTIASGESKAITLDNIGDKVQFFGDNESYGNVLIFADGSKISCSADCYIYGNIMSLVSSTGYASEVALTSGYTFYYLFYNNSKIKNKTGAALLLPATTLTNGCYGSMFQGCSGLTVAPELPATSLKNHCYSYMFAGCAITTAPVLPAMNLEASCYSEMFRGCTSLTEAPELPAMELKDSCYQSMFSYCTSLTAAPELPATSLANNCYDSMFSDCTSLTEAPELPAMELKDSCYQSMFSYCTSLTATPELPATSLKSNCYNSMFQNCTSLTTAPELPAEWMKDSCYQSMFSGCTSLTVVPELPALELDDSCYQSMFSGCTSLTSAPMLYITTLAVSCYQGMFSDCTSLTEAPELPATTLEEGCYQSMFSGCTSLTTVPELPAPTLVSNCYQSMFQGCERLRRVTCLATDISATDCTKDWLDGVYHHPYDTGTFYKASSMTDWPSGVDGIPDTWTVENAP